LLLFTEAALDCLTLPDGGPDQRPEHFVFGNFLLVTVGVDFLLQAGASSGRSGDQPLGTLHREDNGRWSARDESGDRVGGDAATRNGALRLFLCHLGLAEADLARLPSHLRRR
jgi:hypothetical protein